MFRMISGALAGYLVVAALAPCATAEEKQAPDAAPGRRVVSLNGHSFTLPEGFVIELAVPPALVPRPITADFDERGRLYVADSSGSNEKVQEQLEKRPHRILRLEDTDGDGVFDKRTVFADRMMFPEGTMWLGGSLYVAAPPSIWKLTDTDDDGVADERVEWFQGKTLTGCANDLHGPYRGPDGWIYWCKGAFARQTYPRPGKPDFSTRAAHIFRCRPDGSGLEPVMTGGMDNPVDVVFLPGGERIFTTTFFQHPGHGLRDGLIHAVHGAVYGKVHDVIYEHPWTGPEVMPVLAHMGAAAPCGLARYEGASFGPAYRDSLFACQFNMRKVSRHVLAPRGATYVSHDEDFLVSDNRDFHPTDVVEDADGSLLVVDTGGWYKLCCPTSQLYKPDILGGIYRVRRKDAPRPADPRGLRLQWETAPARELVALLDDPRAVVRRRAVDALAARGDGVLADLEGVLADRAAPTERHRNAVWTLIRIDHPRARTLVRECLASPAKAVRQVALQGVSLWRDREAADQLLRLLEAGSPLERRLAAESLGRLGDASAVPALLKAGETAGDRFLEHALCYAIIEVGARGPVERHGLSSASPAVLRAALTALDQMPGGSLSPATVLRHLSTTDARLRETLLWIAGRHPEWGGDLAGYFREQLAEAHAAPQPAREDLRGLLVRFAGSPPVQALVAERVRQASLPRPTRSLLLSVIAESGLKEAPASWVAALTDLLGRADVSLLQEATLAARRMSIPPRKTAALIPALLRVAENDDHPEALRLGALAAVPGGVRGVSPGLFQVICKYLDRESPVQERGLAADIVARAGLSREQLLVLAGEVLPRVGPLEIDRVLEILGKTTDEQVGLAVLSALKTSPVLESLRVDMIRPRVAKYPAGVQQQAEELYARINADLARQREKLASLERSLVEGDERRGQAVFHSPRAACASCHALGYLGGRAGPDLTRIAQVRSRRDLLESIVFPSSSLVRSYEPILVVTTSGKVYNGLVKQQTPEEVELTLGVDQTVRIPRQDIEEIQPSKVSIMPAGIDQSLTPQELADLLAFLLSRK